MQHKPADQLIMIKYVSPNIKTALCKLMLDRQLCTRSAST